MLDRTECPILTIQMSFSSFDAMQDFKGIMKKDSISRINFKAGSTEITDPNFFFYFPTVAGSAIWALGIIIHIDLFSSLYENLFSSLWSVKVCLKILGFKSNDGFKDVRIQGNKDKTGGF